MARKAKPGRERCGICRHPDRVLIEHSRIAGLSVEALAVKHSVSRDALYRHMRNHVSEEQRASYIADIPIKELAAKAIEEGAALLEYFAIVRGELMRHFMLAASLNDRNGTATIGRALTEVLREIGKLTGELLNAAPITNIQNNYNLFASSPVFTELQAMLVNRLAPFPDALNAVLAGLEELEATAAAKSEPALLELKANAHD